MQGLERLRAAPSRIPLPDGLIEILSWSYSPHLLDNAPHRHTYFEVCQVGRYGSGVYCVEGNPNLIGPGDLFIARPGVVHQIHNREEPGMELRWVSFQWLPDNGKEGETGRLMRAFASSSRWVIPDSDARTDSLWRALEAACLSPHPLGFELQLQGLISALLLGIARAACDLESVPEITLQDTDQDHHIARIAIRYIHDNLDRPLSIPEIADHLCLSARHFCRLFKRFTENPPAAYITQARMDRARSLLLATDEPIKQVARSVGYEDVHYFTRLFTRCHGCSPGQFRREKGGGRVLKVQKYGALV